jgi:hypothetical protein
MKSNKKKKEEAAVKPVGPAKSMEELAGLVFDVPCANCGETVFTLPYVAGASHFVHCHKCGKGTWVGIDEEGSLAHMPEEVIQERIERIRKYADGFLSILQGGNTCPACSQWGHGWKLGSITVKGAEVVCGFRCPNCGREGIVNRYSPLAWLAEEE